MKFQNALLKYDFNDHDYDNIIKIFLTLLHNRSLKKVFKSESCQFYEKTIKEGNNEKIKA